MVLHVLVASFLCALLFWPGQALGRVYETETAPTNVFTFDAYLGPGDSTELNAPSSRFAPDWEITRGTVDFLDNSILCREQRSCLNLDGAGGGGARLETRDLYAPGRWYIKADLAANPDPRGPLALDYVNIGIGDKAARIGLSNRVSRWQSRDLSLSTNIVFAGIEPAPFFFDHSGGDGSGVILLRAEISAVPLPAGLPLLGAAVAGLGVLAAVRRRR